MHAHVASICIVADDDVMMMTCLYDLLIYQHQIYYLPVSNAATQQPEVQYVSLAKCNEVSRPVFQNPNSKHELQQIKGKKVKVVDLYSASS